MLSRNRQGRRRHGSGSTAGRTMRRCLARTRDGVAASRSDETRFRLACAARDAEAEDQGHSGVVALHAGRRDWIGSEATDRRGKRR